MTVDELLAPRDLAFQLYDVLDAVGLTRRARFADHSRETFDAALETARLIALERFAPHNRRADEHEPRLVDGKVHILPEVLDAVRAYCAAGLAAATDDYENGGMQLPVLVAQACRSYFSSANIATTSYLTLTSSNAHVIERFGTPAQKRRYLAGLRAGRFFGTMVLTEPQAGSSLSDLASSATPLPDGTYSVKGQKIFISGGDHELAENIVHLVLARLPDAPAGVKGISLFTVPKYHVDEEGRVGDRNDVALAGLIHKCGWRGTTSTLLSFGENGRCIGELVGHPHEGLAAMFLMMNEARIGIGVGAAMLGYRGYLAALRYARERPQGRHPGNKNPREPQLPLIEHADVRRMLLAQKAYVEGAFSLTLFAARLVDEQRTGETEPARAEAGLLLELLTPVVKSWPSEFCLQANSLAIQVHGGYGYTREFPVEQYWRDNRLNMIHEGTHGIQAMDLLGRKVYLQEGAALKAFERRLRETLADVAPFDALRAHAAALEKACDAAAATVRELAPLLLQDARAGLSNASAFLEAFGHIVIAWTWLRQAGAAARLLPGASGEDAAFLRGKLQACRWFFQWELPKVEPMLARVRERDDTNDTMSPDWF
jgi:butyryl-CoA dehydrogenase